MISKFQIGLKSLLRQGPSESKFYGDLVYKLKKVVGSYHFSAQFNTTHARVSVLWTSNYQFLDEISHSEEQNKKGAKIRNRYNQAPHLTQDTNRKVTASQLDITNKSQEVSPFPVGDHKASINRRVRKHNKTRHK